MRKEKKKEEKKKNRWLDTGTVMVLLYWGIGLIVLGGILTMFALTMTSSLHYTTPTGFFLLFSVSTLITGLAFPIIVFLLSLYEKLSKIFQERE